MLRLPTIFARPSRRRMLGALGAAAASVALWPTRGNAQIPAAANPSTHVYRKEFGMDYISTTEGVRIYFKDWGKGQPILFHHGWPLSADDWDAQMMYFLNEGFRVIAHDRRGHGRSSQTDSGNDMDTYADDLAQLIAALDLRDVVHVGHSTGGGEVVRFLSRHGTSRAAKAVIIGAIPPVMVKSTKNPGGLPIEVFDGFRTQFLANRAQFYRDIAAGPFYGFNRAGAAVSQAVIDNWCRQGMTGGAKPHYDCIAVFSETDFSDDLPRIDIPLLIMHGDDDQIVPIADSALLAVKLAPKATLKVYPGLSHGMATTHPDVINPDLLAFIRAR